LKKESAFSVVNYLRKRSDKIASRFLDPGEALLWSGIPGFVDVIAVRDAVYLPFFAINAAIIFLLFSRMEYRSYFENFSSPTNVLVPNYDYIATVELAHILLILLLFTVRLLYRYFSTAGHIYAVTDRRVMIIRGKITREIKADALKSVAVNKRLFGGSVVFNSDKGDGFFAKGGYLPSHIRGVTAFFNIADLDGAAEAIARLSKRIMFRDK